MAPCNYWNIPLVSMRLFCKYTNNVNISYLFQVIDLISEINQLLQLCTARTAWSDSVIRSEISSITESDRIRPIR